MTKIERLQKTVSLKLGKELPTETLEALYRYSHAVGAFDELLCGLDRRRVETDDDGNFWDVRTNARGYETARHKVTDPRPGSIKRANAHAKPFGLRVYHQTDPRGVALYLIPASIPEAEADSRYLSEGVALWLD